jgi:hypothetical protein
VPDTGQQADDGRHETRLERLDRNLAELVAELRVVQTGVQVLFAFLLTVPFQNAFAKVTSFERAVYFVTLLLAALAAACLIAPTAQHRLLFRAEDKEHIVFLGNKLAIAGLACLTLAMAGALLLVTTKLFGTSAGLITVVVGVTPFLALWFVMPLRRRRALEHRQEKPSAPSPGGDGDGSPLVATARSGSWPGSGADHAD